MKFPKIVLLLFILAGVFYACQRELYFDGYSNGKLKHDVPGNCLPIQPHGIFRVDTALGSNFYVEVQADVVQPGKIDIHSDTINGFYFHGTGTVVKGTNTIRLEASGKPIAKGDNQFHITYGSSACDFIVRVEDTPDATFTLGGSPNACTGVFVNGTYNKNVPLSTGNSITLLVNVNTPGRYVIKATTNNGFQFDGNGIFQFPGVQNVTLTGSGTPVREEITTVMADNIVSHCTLPITVAVQDDGKAIFSFDGTPGACFNANVNGDYYASINSAFQNTVSLGVNVTKTGTYAINTNTANGFTFSASGVFAATGQQTVTLNATGIPLHAEATAFIPNTGTQACNFTVIVQPLPPPATFTLSGAPNACTAATVNGFYIHNKPLDAANTVTLQVNVTAPGSYNFSTNTSNGFSFSTSGVFTTTGLQTVVLHGVGTPLTTGSTTITPGFGGSACSFTVTVI
ncbi:MAG: hypothetical protein JST86_06955 [Bacteroidetes bacterium]|nr:hypothetical protein [Bacteroidota bacterium]